MFSCWQWPPPEKMGPRCFLAGNGLRPKKWGEDAFLGEDVFLLAMAGDKMGPRCFLAGNGRRQNGAKMFSCWQWPETRRGQDVFLLAMAGDKMGQRDPRLSGGSGRHP